MAVFIGSRREFVWDDFLIDSSKTTAQRRLHSPVRREISMEFGKPWEGDGCDYFSAVYDTEKKLWRMYYTAWEMLSGDKTSHVVDFVKICCVESRDGLNWQRPSLGIVDFDGSRDNNIVLTHAMFEGMTSLDNFFVFADPNPSPAVPGRFKACMSYATLRPDGKLGHRLVSLKSDDGYHFEMVGEIVRGVQLDSLNTISWHPETKQYFCFFRHFHDPLTKEDFDIEKHSDANPFVRDIRVCTSPDFLTWSAHQPLCYGDAEDVPLYTNCIFPYPGGEHMLVGFPTRYVERKQWTKNYDRLCGSEKRKERCAIHPRYGLTTTDCLFMCSRDGVNWTRSDEAFLRPGPEFAANWVYGSCYPILGLFSAPSDTLGAEEEWCMYITDQHWMSRPTEMTRLSLRKDGFVSLHAGSKEEKIVTKAFTFEGSQLEINFSTSARGYLYLRLCADDGTCTLSSDELFGDSIRRVVDFDAPLSALEGKSVHMEIEMLDADFYAFRFSNP